MHASFVVKIMVFQYKIMKILDNETLKYDRMSCNLVQVFTLHKELMDTVKFYQFKVIMLNYTEH